MIEAFSRLRNPEGEPIIVPTLIFVCGVSAIGKTTMANLSCDMLAEFGIAAKRPISYTTRPIRECETDGIDYHFITRELFEQIYSTEIVKNPENWDLSEIAGNWYFNKLSDTVPTDSCPVSIVPVSYRTCEQMVKLYSDRFPKLNIKVIVLKLNERNIVAWKQKMGEIRTNRDLTAEEMLDNTFSPPENCIAETIYPELILDADRVRFFISIIKAITE